MRQPLAHHDSRGVRNLDARDARDTKGRQMGQPGRAMKRSLGLSSVIWEAWTLSKPGPDRPPRRHIVAGANALAAALVDRHYEQGNLGPMQFLEPVP